MAVLASAAIPRLRVAVRYMRRYPRIMRTKPTSLLFVTVCWKSRCWSISRFVLDVVKFFLESDNQNVSWQESPERDGRFKDICYIPQVACIHRAEAHHNLKKMIANLIFYHPDCVSCISRAQRRVVQSDFPVQRQELDTRGIAMVFSAGLRLKRANRRNNGG